MLRQIGLQTAHDLNLPVQPTLQEWSQGMLNPAGVAGKSMKDALAKSAVMPTIVAAGPTVRQSLLRQQHKGISSSQESRPEAISGKRVSFVCPDK